MILILTRQLEPTTDGVLRALTRNGVAWARLNTEDFPTRAEVSLDPIAPGRSYVRTGSGKQVPLSEIRSVWIWKRGAFAVAKELAPSHQDLVEGACQDTMGAMLEQLEEQVGSFMVNPLRGARQASDKSLQLRYAQEAGLETPETLITNSAGAARAFCARHEFVAFKLINRAPMARAGTPQTGGVYTSLLKASDLDRIDTLDGCPGVFQAYVPKQFDLRVTVVGNALFPVEVHSQTDPKTAVDFRRGWKHEISLEHKVHRLPPAIQLDCLRLMRRLGLAYGAIDLVVTAEGRYVFLEVNPSGMYGWVEDETGLPITDALAAMLSRGSIG